MKIKKRYLIPIILIGILILLRVLLPSMVKNYVNRVLADIPGYYGQVSDIDISLIRGAYVIEGLYLNKGTAASQIPFLDFEKTDISIEWKSLFKGKIVSEIIMTRPKITYVLEDQKKEGEETSEVSDWTKALTDLVPIAINRLKVSQGRIAFVQLEANPPIDLQFNTIEMNATNLRNIVRERRELPSTILATAVATGQGKVTLEGKMDLVKQIPDMDISFSLENTAATALNDFTNHYAGIDFNKGKFNMYSEVAIADGFLKGYIKPMLIEVKLVGDEDGFFNTLWEGFVGFFKFILKNQKKDTLATKIPLEGDLNQVESEIWTTVITIFKNAWIEALKRDIDDEINFEAVQDAAQH